jgi:hypothetical protein
MYQNPLELDVKFAVLIRGQDVTAYGTLASGHPLANGRPAYVHQYMTMTPPLIYYVCRDSLS